MMVVDVILQYEFVQSPPFHCFMYGLPFLENAVEPTHLAIDGISLANHTLGHCFVQVTRPVCVEYAVEQGAGSEAVEAERFTATQEYDGWCQAGLLDNPQSIEPGSIKYIGEATQWENDCRIVQSSPIDHHGLPAVLHPPARWGSLQQQRTCMT